MILVGQALSLIFGSGTHGTYFSFSSMILSRVPRCVNFGIFTLAKTRSITRVEQVMDRGDTIGLFFGRNVPTLRLSPKISSCDGTEIRPVVIKSSIKYVDILGMYVKVRTYNKH